MSAIPENNWRTRSLPHIRQTMGSPFTFSVIVATTVKVDSQSSHLYSYNGIARFSFFAFFLQQFVRKLVNIGNGTLFDAFCKFNCLGNFA